MGLLRQCLGPWPGLACPAGALARRARCPDCERAYDRRRRPQPAQRGHDSAYRRARARLIGLPCELRLPGCTGIATTADYIIPVSRGGSLNDGLRPACAHCNSSRGNRIEGEPNR